MSLTRFIKDTAKAKVESVTVIVAALLAFFTAMMYPYISVGTAVILLAAIGLYRSVRKHRQEKGYLNS